MTVPFWFWIAFVMALFGAACLGALLMAMIAAGGRADEGRPGAHPPAECEHCGRSHTPQKPVQCVRDPFIWELDGKCVMRWFCFDCEEERRYDI